MKKKYFAFTLDLESDHSGLLEEKQSKSLESLDEIESFLRMLTEEKVRLSVFVVGRLLEKYHELIELFKRYGAEFHGHSYSHDPSAADSKEEVWKCRQAFEAYFKIPPLGYRAPQGKITDQGIANLEEAGFQFDASVFPSYYPHPRYMFFPRKPHFYKKTSILEIPNSSLTPFQLTFSISYIKLFGFHLYRTLMELWMIPDVVVFGSHLHDFLIHQQYIRKLPFFWRVIYSRNSDKGIEYTRRMIHLFRRKGYQFVYMSQIHSMFRSQTHDPSENGCE
ncbi:MAG: polysaccharide deacetylase family protein [Acidobacteriota bacterium]|jgi:peptidoglycan/xylan/chitin deacetylase (PgdA/CDA1 family)|nr:polysaccharide deacetylase family protein [Acidobacteriota bacterium]